MISVFQDKDEIIIVGVNADGSPMDKDGSLFGHESGRDIDTFERSDIDTDKGHVAIIELAALIYTRKRTCGRGNQIITRLLLGAS